MISGHDFRDILDYDIPAIERAVHAYGLNRDDVIARELASLDCDIETWELLHPQIRDACIPSFDQGSYRSIRAATAMRPERPWK